MAIWHAGMPICILYFKLSFVVKGKMGKYSEGICAVFALKPAKWPEIYKFPAYGYMIFYISYTNFYT